MLNQAVFWQRVANDYWERRKSNSAMTLIGTMGAMGVSEEDTWRHAVRYCAVGICATLPSGKIWNRESRLKGRNRL